MHMKLKGVFPKKSLFKNSIPIPKWNTCSHWFSCVNSPKKGGSLLKITVMIELQYAISHLNDCVRREKTHFPSFVIQLWLLLYVMYMERSIEHVKFPHENNFQLFRQFSFQKFAHFKKSPSAQNSFVIFKLLHFYASLNIEKLNVFLSSGGYCTLTLSYISTSVCQHVCVAIVQSPFCERK